MSQKSKSCNLSVNSASQEISISGISDETLLIPYGKDIELTDFVSLLSQRIDSGVGIILPKCEEQADPKLAIILDTIFKIIDEYNSSIQQTETTSELKEVDQKDKNGEPLG